MPATAQWEGHRLADGRYRVRSRLGGSTTASVYLAEDSQTGKAVVIKAFGSSFASTTEYVERFIAEAKRVARLVHPRLIRILDVGEHENVRFIALPHLGGRTLRDRQPKGLDGAPWPVPYKCLASWLEQIASALDFLHANNVVHGAVKLENILFNEQGEPFLSEPAVTSLAVEYEDGNAKTGPLVGAKEASASQQSWLEPNSKNRKYAAGADQFDLAAIVYELLSGCRPCGSRNPDNGGSPTEHNHRALRLLRPKVPRNLSDAVDKALSPDPAKRFQSCVAFAQMALASPTTIRCPGCDKELRVPNHERVRVRCSGCQLVFAVKDCLTSRPGFEPPPYVVHLDNPRQSQSVAQSHFSSSPASGPHKAVQGGGWRFPTLLGAIILSISVALIFWTRGSGSKTAQVELAPKGFDRLLTYAPTASEFAVGVDLAQMRQFRPFFEKWANAGGGPSDSEFLRFVEKAIVTGKNLERCVLIIETAVPISDGRIQQVFGCDPSRQVGGKKIFPNVTRLGPSGAIVKPTDTTLVFGPLSESDLLDLGSIQKSQLIADVSSMVGRLKTCPVWGVFFLQNEKWREATRSWIGVFPPLKEGGVELLHRSRTGFFTVETVEKDLHVRFGVQCATATDAKHVEWLSAEIWKGEAAKTLREHQKHPLFPEAIPLVSDVLSSFEVQKTGQTVTAQFEVQDRSVKALQKLVP